MTDYFWIHVYVPLLFANIVDMHIYVTAAVHSNLYIYQSYYDKYTNYYALQQCDSAFAVLTSESDPCHFVASCYMYTNSKSNNN